MKKIIFIVFINLLSSSYIIADIQIRLKFNIILHPTNQQRPSYATDHLINECVKGMNEIISKTERGYKFTLTGIEEVGGSQLGPSYYYYTYFTKSQRDQFEFEAEKKTEEFGWEDNSINIYINDHYNLDDNIDISAGLCSLPGSEEIVIVDHKFIIDYYLLIHEIGHYFNLCHTQGCCCSYCGNCVGDGPWVFDFCNEIFSNPVDDKVDDTIRDDACWDLDGIAQYNYGKDYLSLSQENKINVDNVAYNIMSYHHNAPLSAASTYILTEGQINRWSDAMDSGNRRDVRNGETWFCDGDITITPGIDQAFNIPGATSGTAMSDLNYILDECANNSNIVFFPGNVKGSYVINKKVTLIATRQGSVTIGAE